MKALLSFSTIFAFLFVLGVQTFQPFKMEKQEYSSTSALEKQLRKEFTFDCNGNYYEEMWKKIDSLEQKGMTREALDLTEKIFAQSKQENNGNQNVKSLIYIMKYKQVIEENSDSLNMLRIEKEVKEAKTPIKQILQSIQAEMYLQYYNSMRWEIMNRTATVNWENPDYQTWSAAQFIAKVHSLYLASLEQKGELQKADINDYKDILNRGDAESPKYRPTLYDLLAHRALDNFYMSTEYDITQPAYKFVLEAEQGLAHFPDFIAQKFESKDSSSRDLHAVHIFQTLLTKYQDGGNLEALLEVDLKRLSWAKERAAGSDKDTLYVRNLAFLEKKYAGKEATAIVSAEIADIYEARGNKYNALDSDKYRWDKVRASEICNKIKKDFPNSRGAKKADDILARIAAKELSFKVEEVNLPNLPFRGRVAFKNVSKVYLRIINRTEAIEKRLNEVYETEKRADILRKETPLKTWDLVLPDEKDFQNHSSEIKMPEMPIGKYYILMSDNAEFSIDKKALAYTPCDVGTISYYKQTRGNATEVFFTDRGTGEPIRNTEVTEYVWNYRSYDYKKVGALKTDENGMVTTKYVQNAQDYSRNVMLEIKRGNEVYKTSGMYQYDNRENPQEQDYAMLFTDRKIYRPGQTVYFKGILLKRKIDEMSVILPNKTVEVVFTDANWQKVGALALTSNQYGSITGTFTAPTSGLMGNMRLSCLNAQTDFNVEEYKRPKFEVKMKDLEGNYQLGDKVTAKGNAMGFAGNAIDGAEVRYRVVRQARYPFWGYYCWWRPMPSTASMEISNGKTKTDAEGNFSIDFTAIPDRSVDKADKPIFSYTVYADVVDITGETHSSSQSLQLGYISLNASMDISAEMDKSNIKADSISLNTTNLNGVFTPAKGKVSIYRLETPKQTFRSRRWERSDLHLISEADYRKFFPNDVYKDENDERNWKREEKALEIAFDTEKAKKYSLNELSFKKEGRYVAELITQDKGGNEVKIISYFTLNNSKVREMALPVTLKGKLNKNAAEPTETLHYEVSSAEKSLWVTYQLTRNSQILDRQFLHLTKGGSKIIDIPIKEEYRGGLSLSVATMSNNQFYSESANIDVPWTNKDLKLEWMTFRNKVLPGAKETWKLKISGAKGEKVAAEMLATMYDASLDEFRSNSIDMSGLNPGNYNRFYWEMGEGFGIEYNQLLANNWNISGVSGYGISYDYLNLFGFYFGNGRYRNMVMYDKMESRAEGLTMAAPPPPAPAPAMSAQTAKPKMKVMTKDHSERKKLTEDSDEDGAPDMFDREPETPSTDSMVTGKDEKPKEKKEVQIRKNLQETAFFFPQLETNEAGEIILNFTMPEALTKWKFLGLAHSKDLKVGTLGGFTQTQKEVMIMPSTPRFLRVGDKVTLTGKVVNLSDKTISGVAEIKLLDALTGKEVLADFSVNNFQQKFSIEKGKSEAFEWILNVPETVQAITYQMIADAGEFADGEENALPVIPNKMLVTETLPLPIRGNSEKDFSFQNLIDAKNSTTLQNQRFTLEFTSNPAWYAVQALPYLMEYPHECTEQIFSRYYANALASHIANSSPKVKQVFEQWKNAVVADGGKNALLSNLAKNQELKSALLEETPWVLNAANETDRKNRVALLFDLNKMASELEKAEKQLEERQANDGSFAWFPGMSRNRYITQLLMTGFGHLKKLGVETGAQTNKMAANGVPYLDSEITNDLQYLKRYKIDLEKDNLGYDQIQYLYMRSFYPNISVGLGNKEAHDYYMKQSKKFWVDKSMYMKGMIALYLNRAGDATTAKEIVKSLAQNAVFNDEMGMYWKQNAGYWWYEAPIEMQALLIECFQEVTKDTKSVEEMKIWLLKNKQTNDWKTTRATVEACNALLLTGSNLLESNALVQVSLGGQLINPTERPDAKVEAGTGYYKTAWQGKEFSSDFGKIHVKKTDAGVAWGAAYWQYFEQLDKIKFATTPLAIQKKLFIETPSDKGPVLAPITSTNAIKQGDKIVVRIEIRVDRDMEYVHLKDMRAAGFEPINVISQYKYQGGLGYYESTKDVATHFFIDFLPKGTYVFEYPLRATHKGDFSNGITTMQCMYAPEFSSHSEGIRVKVE